MHQNYLVVGPLRAHLYHYIVLSLLIATIQIPGLKGMEREKGGGRERYVAGKEGKRKRRRSGNKYRITSPTVVSKSGL